MNEKDARHLCLISGGKDSTALAIHLHDTRPELDLEFLFCDTHKELPETYEYLDRVEAYIGKPITRLACEHEDRGFDFYLQMYRNFLPSASARWCTRMLKIRPFEKFIGDDNVVLYIGIRADENRSAYISTKPTIKPVKPFVDEGIKKDDVLRILEQSGVGIPKYYEWRSRSGCYFCFYQRRIEWVRLKERHPDLFALAKEYEKPNEGFTWSERESLDELERPERMKQIIKEDAERRKRLAKRRKPQTLAELFAPEEIDPDEATGCLICHL